MTILEILVSASILVVALFALFSALLGGQTVTGQSRERAQAALQAASRLEEVMALSWDDLGALITTPPAPQDVQFDVTPATTVKLKPVAGQTKAMFVTVVNTALPDLRQVRVRVRWRSSVGGANGSSDADLNMYALIAKH